MTEANTLLTHVTALTNDPSDVSSWKTLLEALMLDPGVEEEVYSAVPELTKATLMLSTHSCYLMAVATRLIVLRSGTAWASASPSVKLAFEASMASLFRHVLDAIEDKHTRQQRRWMLCFLAARQGLTTYATAMLEYSEEELADFMIVETA